MKLSQILWIAIVGLLCLLAATYAQVAHGPSGSESFPIPRVTNSPSPAQAAIAAPLRKPPSVVSGEVAEDHGEWSRKVQRITYASSADHSNQLAMFYNAGDVTGVGKFII